MYYSHTRWVVPLDIPGSIPGQYEGPVIKGKEKEEKLVQV